MEVTFNLNEVLKSDFMVLSFGEDLKNLMEQPVKSYQNFIRSKDREKIMKSSFRVSSSEIVDFLEKVLGLELDREYNNYKRNQLNLLIRKISPTQKGKKTVLDYYQFRDLILLEDFNKFVLNNFSADRAGDEERAYQEIMFLQQNKFKETQLYKAQRKEDMETTEYALSLIAGLGDVLRNRYALFEELLENNISYEDIDVPDEVKELLEIISYRERQTNSNFTVYKFDSVEDVETTNDEQIIRFFLADVDSWANEILDR
ncbi:hypothetical protein [Lactococcus lactis]|uniref:Uncharacterized protein n=1 Tax=Lactococcus lactis TaxID=1358 RepID=A0AAP8DZI7_9LACT|nr:hypothetical protein [Lactococcus lactis]MDG4972619.1 hypothetical protein [Lactococcus lactis]PFG87533.1 hypothetical protein BW154_12445 [Lactococcus lactis]